MKELVMIGTAVGIGVLSNHGAEFDVKQTAYDSREACLSDWGTDAECRSTAGHSGAYIGPRYYWDTSRGCPVVINADGSEHVTTAPRVGLNGSSGGRTTVVGTFARGGFGHIGRGFSAGRGG